MCVQEDLRIEQKPSCELTDEDYDKMKKGMERAANKAIDEGWTIDKILAYWGIVE